MNNNLMERKKEEALCRMRLMGLREEYIRDFEQDGKIHLSAGDGTLPELTAKDMAMIRRFEREHDALVFLVVRADLGFCVMDSLFYVSQYEEEWPMEHEDLKAGYALTYTVNYQYPDCSEFGSIAFGRTPEGEIVRRG